MMEYSLGVYRAAYYIEESMGLLRLQQEISCIYLLVIVHILHAAKIHSNRW